MESTGSALGEIAHLGALELLTPRLDKSLGSSATCSAWRWSIASATSSICAATAITPPARSRSGRRRVRASAASTGAPPVPTRSPVGRRRSRRRGEASLGAPPISAAAGRFTSATPMATRCPSISRKSPIAPRRLRSTLKNLPMKYAARGVNVRRLDHLAVLCRDVPANRRFAEDLLGMRLHEQVLFERGTREIGSWLSPSVIHHQLAYVLDVKGGSGRLHHFRSGSTIARMCCAPPTS